MSRRSSKRRRLFAFLIGFVAIIAILIGFTEPGRALTDLLRHGVIQGYLQKGEKRAYEGDTQDNLKALHTALMLYHDSEGQFPLAEGWMDAIENRLKTADMTSEEAGKKLIRPGVTEGFGYALNQAASGKYRDDIAKTETVLVYESKSTARNASGDPKTDALPGGATVSLDGKVP